jgi:hypothetical protein
MRANINGFQLGSGSSFKISNIEGLSKPPIRTSSQNYSGRHGGRVNRQLYGSRLITVTGWFSHLTCAAHEAARDALESVLPIGEDLDIIIDRFSGTQGFTTARLVDFRMPYAPGGLGKLTDYKIDLYCGDPNFYIGDELSATLPLFAPGGVVLPVVLPATFAAGSSDTVATNNGRVLVFPVITLTGEAHNPEFTNTDSGESVAVPVTMSTGDVLVIDMGRRTISLNGGSVIGLATSRQWFGLDVGANHIRYETTDSGDDGEAVMTWRNAVESM